MQVSIIATMFYISLCVICAVLLKQSLTFKHHGIDTSLQKPLYAPSMRRLLRICKYTWKRYGGKVSARLMLHSGIQIKRVLYRLLRTVSHGLTSLIHRLEHHERQTRKTILEHKLKKQGLEARQSPSITEHFSDIKIRETLDIKNPIPFDSQRYLPITNTPNGPLKRKIIRKSRLTQSIPDNPPHVSQKIPE